MPWSNQPVVAPVVIVTAGAPGTGLFVYSGTPASGNLVASIAAAAGTDPFGNAYKAGIASYGSVNYSQLLAGALVVAPKAGGPAFPPNVAATGGDLLLQSGSSGADGSLIDIQESSGVLIETQAGQPNDPLLELSGVLQLDNKGTPAAPSGAVKLYGNSGRAGMIHPSGLAMSAPGAQAADFSVGTVTAASLTNLTSFTIPATDAAAGTVYEIEAWGNGTWGATAQTLELAVSLGGNTMTNLTLGSSFFAVSQLFRWRIAARVICVTPGVSGTWTSLLSGEISAFGNNLLPQVGSQATGGFVSCESSGTTTVDSTSNETFALQAAWGATTGAPTITKRAAIFKRIAG